MRTESVASPASVGLTWQRLAPTLAQTPCLTLAQVHSEQYTLVWVDVVKVHELRQVEQSLPPSSQQAVSPRGPCAPPDNFFKSSVEYILFLPRY